MQKKSTAKILSFMILIAMMLNILVPETATKVLAADEGSIEAVSAVIPQRFMSATATSQNAGYEASNVIDGNPSTIWHIRYDPEPDMLPQSIELKLNRSFNVNKFRLLPRQDNNSNGRITAYNLYISSDGVDYQKVASGTWSDDASEKTVDITPFVSALYVKLETTAGGGNFASAAEINIETTDVTLVRFAATLDEAKNLSENANIGTDVGYYPKDTKDALDLVIARYAGLELDPDATNDQMQEALTELQSAIDTFKKSKVEYSVSRLAWYVDNLSGLYESAVQGTAPGEYTAEAKAAFGSVLDSAKSVVQKQDATDMEADKAYKSLVEAASTFLISSKLAGEPATDNAVSEMMSAEATSQNIGYEAKKAIDGDIASIWHTNYTPTADSLPQSITVDLGRIYNIDSIWVTPRQDSSNGWISDATLYAGTDKENMNFVENSIWNTDASTKTTKINPVRARYVTVQANKGAGNFASIAEMGVGTYDVYVKSLANKINTAKIFYSSVEVGDNPGQYNSEAKSALVQEIADANAILRDPNSLPSEFYATSEKLNDVFIAFMASKIKYTREQLWTVISEAKDMAGAATSPEYAQEDIDALKRAIASADSIAGDINASDEAVDAATIALKDAIAVFQYSIDTVVSLAGKWEFKLGAANGTAQNLYETVNLPGTLDENKKGFINNDTAVRTLSRKYKYTGPAVYQRKFTLPASFEGKQIKLFLERTRETKLWVNDKYVGTQNQLTTNQVYDITQYIQMGDNLITIEVDNSYTDMPWGVLESHMVTENTQTNWNGILGRIEIQVNKALYIDQVRAIPDVNNKTAKVEVDINNTTSGEISGTLSLMAKSWNTDSSHNVPQRPHHVPRQTFNFTVKPGLQTVEVQYKMGEHVQLWDEFNPILYNLKVDMNAKKYTGHTAIDFGMRKFQVNSDRKQFSINGKNIFLRSEANCAVFPLTGFAPMDDEGWEKLFSVYKSYGINHVRFHSWTPPEAAFRVADKMGIYMQPELSLWDTGGTFVSDSDYAYYTKEVESIVKQYANHPSFVMVTWGNELGGDRIRMNDLVEHMRSVDPTRLYAEGSNAWYGWQGPGPKSDFFTAQQWGPKHLRGSYIGLYGHLNDNYPSTMEDYTDAIMGAPVPVFGFEVGQYEIYPDFTEIPKYTGVLEPRNLESFRKALENAGMLDQADQFVKASGELSRISYREEIETALRTPQFAGISLLGLQDFPGQGTALVGMVNALGESKSFSNPDDFKRFNNAIVPLVRMEKMTWQSNETYTAKLQLANYGPTDIAGKPYWTIKKLDGTVVASGEMGSLSAAQGGLRDLGTISADLSSIADAAQLTLEVGIKNKNTTYFNNYDIWVYPEEVDTTAPADVLVVKDFNSEAKNTLKRGGKVLLVPDSTTSALPKSIEGAFITDFWSSAAFGSNQPGTTGLLIDTQHQALKDFPTDYFSNWQWWPLAKNGRPIILDDTPATFKPIVQVIDNFDRNHKLGLLFEANVDGGRLVVSSMDLLDQQDKPEARQMLHSILRYMGSDEFKPENSLDAEYISSIVPATKTNLALNKTRSGFPEPFVTFNTNAGYAYSYDRKWQLVNGNEDYMAGTNAWTNWTEDPKRTEDSIGIDFGSDVQFDSVELDVFTDNDTAPPANVKVQYWNGSDWVDVSGQRNGSFKQGPNIIKFDPVTSSKVNIMMTAGTSGGKLRGIAITELKVYETAPQDSNIGSIRYR